VKKWKKIIALVDGNHLSVQVISNLENTFVSIFALNMTLKL